MYFSSYPWGGHKSFFPEACLTSAKPTDSSCFILLQVKKAYESLDHKSNCSLPQELKQKVLWTKEAVIQKTAENVVRMTEQ